MKKMYISPINKVVELDMESECLIVQSPTPANSDENAISNSVIDGDDDGDGLVKRDNGNLWDDEW